MFFFYCYGDHRDLHVLTHSFPTRRSADLARIADTASCANPLYMAKAMFELIRYSPKELEITCGRPCPQNSGGMESVAHTDSTNCFYASLNPEGGVDRKRVVKGTSVSVNVERGGGCVFKNKNNKNYGS